MFTKPQSHCSLIWSISWCNHFALQLVVVVSSWNVNNITNDRKKSIEARFFYCIAPYQWNSRIERLILCIIQEHYNESDQLKILRPVKLGLMKTHYAKKKIAEKIESKKTNKRNREKCIPAIVVTMDTIQGTHTHRKGKEWVRSKNKSFQRWLW